MNSRSNNRKDSPANGILQTPSERSTAVTTDDLAEAWTDEWGVKYSPDHKRLLRAPWDFDGHYECPEGTETIGNKAFNGCTDLSDIAIAPDHPCYHLDGKTLRVLKTGQVICTLR